MTSPQMTTTAIAVVGRPSSITPAIVQAIIDVVATGNYNKVAADLVEINESTLYEWINKGEEDEKTGIASLYAELSKGLKRAAASSEAAMVQRVREAADGGQLVEVTTLTRKDGTEQTIERYSQPQWLAAATFLERRHPDRWARRERKQIDINEQRHITITRVEVVLNEGPAQPPAIETESRELPPSETN